MLVIIDESWNVIIRYDSVFNFRRVNKEKIIIVHIVRKHKRWVVVSWHVYIFINTPHKRGSALDVFPWKLVFFSFCNRTYRDQVAPPNIKERAHEQQHLRSVLTCDVLVKVGQTCLDKETGFLPEVQKHNVATDESAGWRALLPSHRPHETVQLEIGTDSIYSFVTCWFVTTASRCQRSWSWANSTVNSQPLLTDVSVFLKENCEFDLGRIRRVYI